MITYNCGWEKKQNSRKNSANWKIKLAIKYNLISYVDCTTFTIKIIFHFSIKYERNIVIELSKS